MPVFTEEGYSGIVVGHGSGPRLLTSGSGFHTNFGLAIAPIEMWCHGLPQMGSDIIIYVFLGQMGLEFVPCMQAGVDEKMWSSS